MSEWIKCSDRFPPDNSAVLATDGKIVITVTHVGMDKLVKGERWWTAHGWGGYEWEWDEYDFPERITHWMSLPEPPSTPHD